MNEQESTTSASSAGADITAGEDLTETEAIVRTLLGVSGLTPDEEEVSVLVRTFATLREGIAGLYAIPEVRYGSPGLVFDPDPSFVAWA